MVYGRAEKMRIAISTHVQRMNNGNFKGYVVQQLVLSSQCREQKFFCVDEQESAVLALMDAEKLASGNGYKR